MTGDTFNYAMLAVFGFLFQAELAIWSHLKLRSWLLTAAVLVLPFAGLPLVLWRLRPATKDNQVGGAVTYLGIIAGIAFFLKTVPQDEMPWFVIFAMIFFAGLALINIIDLHLKVLRSDE
jgi:hypothetical protein